jgi:hypothetical protein
MKMKLIKNLAEKCLMPLVKADTHNIFLSDENMIST